MQTGAKSSVSRYAERLERIVQEIRREEEFYYTLQNELLEEKLLLARTESELFQKGTIDGRNEQIRNAQLFEYTGHIQERIKDIEKKMNKQKPLLYAKRRELENLQYYVRLLEALNHHK